jgi:serine/threonine-protein kinase RsbT
MAVDVVVQVAKSDDIVVARQAGRDLAESLGFSLTDLTLITTAISEVARNITSYTNGGEVRVSTVDRQGRIGLVVEAVDFGPGIADIDRALEDGYSTRAGMGLGLPGARRLMDEFEIQSAVGRGTTVIMRKWAPPSV